MKYNNSNNNSSIAQKPWWDEESNVHEAATGVFEWLDERQSYHQERNLHHMRLYSNRTAAAMHGVAFAEFDPWSNDRLRLNVTQSVIDAALAQIATNKPRAMCLTIDGDYKLQRRAKKMTKYLDGQFAALDQYELGLQIAQDAFIFGTGLEKVTPHFGRVCAERVFPDDVVVDDVETRIAGPTQMFHYKEVNADILAARYPDQADDILHSGLLRKEQWSRERLSCPVGLLEAWKLPPAPGKKGRHVLVTDRCTLVDDDCERFPFSVFRWKRPPIGWWGTGIAEEVCSIQVEINYLLQKIQRLMTLATSQVWVEKGTVNKRFLNNEDWAVREYTGRPPVFATVAAVSPEYFSQLDRLYNRAYEITGISQLSAQAQKPAGLDSGEALKTYNDIGSARFLHVSQRYERFHMEAGELMLCASREIEEEGGDEDDYDDDGYGSRLKVKAPTKRGIEELRFADIDMSRDKYILRLFPTGFLPVTPAGKLDAIEQFGKISPEIQQYMLSLLDFPDLDSAVSLINAPLDIADMAIEQILEEGTPVSPEPFWNLELTKNRSTLALAKAQVNKVEPENIELLRRFIEQTQQMIDDAAAALAAPPMGAPPEAAPMGAPPAGAPEGMAMGGLPPSVGAMMPPAAA